MMSKSVEKFVVGKLYRFKKGYESRPSLCPLHYYADKGEVVEFNGQNLGCARFTFMRRNKEIIMSGVDAFRYLEEVE